MDMILKAFKKLLFSNSLPKQMEKVEHNRWAQPTAVTDQDQSTGHSQRDIAQISICCIISNTIISMFESILTLLWFFLFYNDETALLNIGLNMTPPSTTLT